MQEREYFRFQEGKCTSQQRVQSIFSSTESKTNQCQYLGLTPEVKDLTFDMPQYGLQPGGHGCSMNIKVLGPISQGNKKELPIPDPEIYDRHVIFNLSA